MRERLQKDLGIINSFLGRLLVAIPLAILSMWFAMHNQLVIMQRWYTHDLVLGVKMVVFFLSWLVVLWFVDVVLFGSSQIDVKRPTLGYWLNSLTKVWKAVILFVLTAYSFFTFVKFDSEIPNQPKIFIEDAETLVGDDLIEMAIRHPDFFKTKEKSYQAERFLNELYSQAYGIRFNGERFKSGQLEGLRIGFWNRRVAECFLILLSTYAVFIITLKLFHFRWQRKMEQIAT
jgi:hypothetical protein